MRRPVRLLSLPLALVLVVAPLSAMAQQVVTPPPLPERFGVKLESDTPGTEYRVYAGRREKVPWFQCTAPCAAEIPRGEYRFETTGPDLADGSVVATIGGPTRVSTQGGSKSSKSGGLVLGITGSAIAAIGLVGMLVESIPRCNTMYGQCNEDPSTEDDRHKGMVAFGVVAGVGALLAAIGWVEFASNRTHMETQTFAPPPPTTTLGIAPTKNGAVIGASGIF